MKILVLGKRGMLGQTIYKYFKQRGYDVKGTTSERYLAMVDKRNEGI